MDIFAWVYSSGALVFATGLVLYWRKHRQTFRDGAFWAAFLLITLFWPLASIVVFAVRTIERNKRASRITSIL